MGLIETLRRDLEGKSLLMRIMKMDDQGETSVSKTERITVTAVSPVSGGQSVDLAYNEKDSMRFLASLVEITRVIDKETGRLKKVFIERNPGHLPSPGITILNKIVELEVEREKRPA